MEGAFGCRRHTLYGKVIWVLQEPAACLVWCSNADWFVHSPTVCVAAVMQETGGDGVGCLFEATGVPPAVNGCFELIR